LSAVNRSSQEAVQKFSCVFLASLEALRQKVPEDFFNLEQPALMKALLVIMFS